MVLCAATCPAGFRICGTHVADQWGDCMKKQLTITYEINDGDMTIYGDETTFDPGITIGEIVDVLATTLAFFGQTVEADMRPALEAAFNFMYNSSKEQGVWNDGLGW